MAYCHEYKCGCIVHQIAGTIRKCDGTVSRSLSGRMAKTDNEAKHNKALGEKPVATYEVADILP